MKKRLLFLFAFVSVTLAALAGPVDKSTARTVASSFLQSVTGKSYSNLTDITAQTPFHEFYLFSLSQSGGFIIVSGDDCVIPILGYSESSPFVTEDIPAHVMEWLQGYENQIAFYREHYGNVSFGGSDLVGRQWQNLMQGGSIESPMRTAVSPLLSTTWGQFPYYNNLCPLDVESGDRAVTGCAATAMAQIMKYWNFPSTGYGTHGYVSSFGYLSSNFGATTFDWNNMPDQLTDQSSATEVNAVATLMFSAGVAINMVYGTIAMGGSAAFTNSNGEIHACSENAFKNYFKYKSSILGVHKEDYSDDAWCALLRSELDANRPILYSGNDPAGGHAFVLDGYDNQGMFHINWGWRGNANGYFFIGAFNVQNGGSSGTSSYNFNLINQAIIGIEPNYYWNTYGSTVVDVEVSNPEWGSAYYDDYYNFGDTITIYATTNRGYRFYNWSDGSTVNYRSFVSVGSDSLNLTATIGPLSGDTIGYGSRGYYGSFGAGTDTNDFYWGIMLPAEVTYSYINNTLTAVETFFTNPGTYDLSIYSGSTAPTTLLASQTYNNDAVLQWVTLPLNNPVTFDTSENIWIILHNYGVYYPAPVSSWGGTGDCLYMGDVFSDINVNYPNYGYSFMINAIFGDHSDASSCQASCAIIGDTIESSQQYSLPVNTYYNYSLSETIIDENEIGGAMDITTISYRYAGANPMTASNYGVKIWIKPTNKSIFTSGIDIELLDNSAVLVYDGTMACSQGWNDIVLTTPYSYDGSGNLMIIVTDTVNGYNSSSHKFSMHNCSGDKSLSWYSDSNIPSPTSSTFTGSRNIYSYRPVMMLKGCVPCQPAQTEIGDVTSTTSEWKVPFNTYYNYSLTETIIDADEMEGAMEISGLNFKYDYATPTTASYYGLKIWLKPTTKTTFSSGSDIELIDASATLVYDGTLSCSQGWNNIAFNTPYHYDGTSNLMVIISDTVNGYNGNSYKFNTSSCTGSKTLAWYSDSQVPSPYDNTFSGTKMALSYRPVMSLDGCIYSSTPATQDEDSLTVVVSVNNPYMGSVLPSTGTLRYGFGDVITISAVPNEGYQFDYWDVNFLGYNYQVEDQSMTDTVNETYFLGQTLNLTAVFSPSADNPCVYYNSIIGDSSSTTTANQYPVNNFYNYSLSETIIEAQEIGSAMTINSISYYYNYTTASTEKTNCTIYVQPTAKTAFTSYTDIEPINPATSVMVYSGALNCQQGWNTFSFSTPYQYDGESNLMIIVDDNSGAYNGGSYSFRTSPCSSYKTLAWYSDTYDPDPSNTSYSGTKNYYQSRVVMSLNGCQEEGPSCPKPIITDVSYAPYDNGYGDFVASLTVQDFDYTAIYQALWIENDSQSIRIIPYGGQGFQVTPIVESFLQIRQICGPGDTSQWSDPVRLYVGYCEPNPYSCDNLGITNVSFGTGTQVVNNSQRPTSAPYYGDYHSLVGDVPAGSMADVSITFETGYTYGTVIWVDWNKNYVFDSNEVVYVGESLNDNPTTLNASFMVPASQDLGLYRMRIAAADSYFNNYITSIAAAAAADPCFSSNYAVAHDYTLNVTEALSCPKPIITDVTYAPYDNGQGDFVASLTVQDFDNTSIYQALWIENDSQSIRIIPYAGQGFQVTPTLESFLQIRQICGPGDTSQWSDPVRLYVGYCEPDPYSCDNQGITNVSFGTGTQVVNNSQYPTSAPYYGDYHSLVGAVAAGTLAEVNITFQTGYTYGTIIWVDWNKNYVFDSNEVVYVGESLNDNPTTLNASFLVPASQETGLYRMRIAAADMYFNNYTNSIAAAAAADPCFSSSYSVAHDYTLNVTESPSCLPVNGVAVASVTSTTATVTFNTTDASSYNVAVYSVEGTLVANATTQSGSVTLSGLDPATTYSVAVQAVCAEETTSTWSNPVVFTTEICDIIDQCPLIIVMNDSYGDGWNGGELAIYDSITSINVATLSLYSSSSDTVLVPLCNGRTFNVEYHSGSFDNEVSFSIYSIGGDSIVSISNPIAGYITSFTHSCSGQTTPDSVTFIISVNDAAMGTVTPGIGIFRYGLGDMLSFSATPNAGYQFDYWEGSLYGDSDTTHMSSFSWTVSQDMLGFTIYLTAYFSPISGDDNTTVITENITACDSYTWHGSTYTASTVAYDTVSIPGSVYDTVYILNLTIGYSSLNESEAVVCDSYDWCGTTYTASGEYEITYSSAYGCDSVMSLQLTIHHSVYDTLYVNADNSYIWNDQTLTESGVYLFVGYTSFGCDSVVFLNLTINGQEPTGVIITENVTACDSYTWRGNIYTESGVVYDTVFSAATFFDTVFILNLTINYSTEGEEEVVACDGYEWNGNILDIPGEYGLQLTNAAGCDSIDRLFLTLNHSVYDTIYETVADSFYYWNEMMLTESGTYTYEGTTSEGCDSLIVLFLTLNGQGPIGINTVDDARIAVYPNPTDGMVTVKADDVQQIDVYDKLGRRLLTVREANTVDLSILPAGEYLLHIFMTDNKAVSRIIKR